jgi:hypothetical protein
MTSGKAANSSLRHIRFNLSTAKLLLIDSQIPSRKDAHLMGKMISIHHYLLKQGVTMQDFQDTIRRARSLQLFDLPGLERYHFLYGVKGAEQGRWAAVWTYSSRTAWEHLWGTVSKPKMRDQYPEKWRRWEDDLLAPLLEGQPDSVMFTAYEEKT